MHVLILIPRIDKSGPVKGALALFNGLLKNNIKVTLLPLNKSQNVNDNNLYSKDLINERSFLSKIARLRNIRSKLSKSGKLIIISYCFKPDLLIFLSGLNKHSISSLRGNLFENYYLDYGFFGKIFALFHYTISLTHSKIVVLNSSMLNTLRLFEKKVLVIENFIDEPVLDYNKNQTENLISFIFVGGLTKRKAIVELLDIARNLKDKKYKFELHVLGDGPEMNNVLLKIDKLGLKDSVFLHGLVDNTFDYLVKSHVFVLPSYSEGTSRAAMEALYAGLPCVMRDVDSNSELINDNNGILCRNTNEIENAMRHYIKNPPFEKKCLLNPPYRQQIGVLKFLDVIENL